MGKKTWQRRWWDALIICNSWCGNADAVPPSSMGLMRRDGERYLPEVTRRDLRRSHQILGKCRSSLVRNAPLMSPQALAHPRLPMLEDIRARWLVHMPSWSQVESRNHGALTAQTRVDGSDAFSSTSGHQSRYQDRVYVGGRSE